MSPLTPEVITALVMGAFGLPATLLAHRAGMRKQAQDADAQFDHRMITALEQRDKTIESQAARITAMQDGMGTLHAQMGRQSAQIEQLLGTQRDRDARERVQLAELAVLTVRVKELDDCKGGQPCPLARRLA